MAKIKKEEIIDWTSHEITKWVMLNLNLGDGYIRLIDCPKFCGYSVQSLSKIIVHMNDAHGLSFLEIADFLEASGLDCDITKKWEFNGYG